MSQEINDRSQRVRPNIGESLPLPVEGTLLRFLVFFSFIKISSLWAFCAKEFKPSLLVRPLRPPIRPCTLHQWPPPSMPTARWSERMSRLHLCWWTLTAGSQEPLLSYFGGSKPTRIVWKYMKVPYFGWINLTLPTILVLTHSHFATNSEHFWRKTRILGHEIIWNGIEKCECILVLSVFWCPAESSSGWWGCLESVVDASSSSHSSPALRPTRQDWALKCFSRLLLPLEHSWWYAFKLIQSKGHEVGDCHRGEKSWGSVFIYVYLKIS